MARPKNDGRGRIGGRQKGTPNKNTPLKTLLQDHSIDYFTPGIAPEEVELEYFMRPQDKEKKMELALQRKEEFVKNNKDTLFSRYELDLRCMKPSDRAKTELDMLNFHTPKMQSISADVAVSKHNITIAERLKRLAAGEDISTDN